MSTTNHGSDCFIKRKSQSIQDWLWRNERDLIAFLFCRKYGDHQFLNWWCNLSAGQVLLNGFKSYDNNT